MYYQIKCICLTVHKNIEFCVADNMSGNLMRQQTQGLSTSLVPFKSNTNLAFTQTSNTACAMYCTLLPCTVLYLGLLSFVSSFLNGKYTWKSILVYFNVLFIFASWFCTLFSILSSLYFGVVLCTVSLFVYSCLFHTFVQIHRPLRIGGNPTAVNKYHIISHNIATSFSQFIIPNFFRITPSDHILCSMCSKQKKLYTETHTTQTEGEAYSSVRVYLLITAVSLATSIGTPGITFCRCKVM